MIPEDESDHTASRRCVAYIDVVLSLLVLRLGTCKRFLKYACMCWRNVCVCMYDRFVCMYVCMCAIRHVGVCLCM